MQSQWPERTLTQIDYVRLTRLASASAAAESGAMQELLETSDLIASEQIPATVITMYSQVLLQGEPETAAYQVTLCYPADADPSKGFISVLSPLGGSLLGLRRGDVARWRGPSGREHTARIVALLFQPEASGDYTL
jgi:regulator of nucleoside diphosphate kinase